MLPLDVIDLSAFAPFILPFGHVSLKNVCNEQNVSIHLHLSPAWHAEPRWWGTGGKLKRERVQVAPPGGQETSSLS